MEEPQIPSVLWIYCALGFFFPSFLLNYYAHLHEKGILVSQSSSAPVAIYSSLHCHSSPQQREGDNWKQRTVAGADKLPRTKGFVVM